MFFEVEHVCTKSLQSCLTLCNPMGCSLPGSSVYGIFPVKILEWVAMPFSMGPSWSRNQTLVSHTSVRFFTVWSHVRSHICMYIHIHIHEKCRAGWITSCNQDRQEKYQQPQICRWHHSNGRKWRGTKEPLGEGERGDWKSWLKTQQAENWDQSHHFMANRRGEVEAVTDCVFLGSKSLLMATATTKLKDACFLKGKLWQT